MLKERGQGWPRDGFGQQREDGVHIMSAMFARLPANDAESLPDRRRVSRSPAEVTALLLSAWGDEAEVRLADVSTHGCSIRSDAAWLRVGAFVSIGFGETPLRAVVRWIRDDAAGMEFLWPVPAERGEWHALINSPFGA